MRKYCTHSNSDNDRVKNLLYDALKVKKGVTMIPLRVEACLFGDRFSNAQLETVQYLIDQSGNVRSPMTVSARELAHGEVGTFAVDFRSLFSRSFKAVKMFLDGDLDAYKGSTSDSFRMLCACNTLSTFLTAKDFHEECLWLLDEYEMRSEIGTEPVITALIANHLLSRLAKDKHGGYILSNDSRGKVLMCPCKNPSCEDPIHYGGSAFGSEYLWYGKPDIVLYPAESGGALNVVIPQKDTFLAIDIEEQCEGQIVEVKDNSSTLRDKKSVKQIVAQAITFSFFQNKFQAVCNDPSAFLIPTIAACSSSFDIYMYDAKNDILLRNAGDPIPFWTDRHLQMSSVLQLWMLINHLLLRPSLNDQDLNRLSGTCGLREHLDEKRLEMINDTLKSQEVFMRGWKMPEYKALHYFHRTTP